MCQCRKTQLSPNQEREYAHCLRVLQAEGICVDIPDKWLEHSPSLEAVIARPPVSVAFDWPSGGTGHAVWVRLVSRSRCMVEECALAVPWDGDVVIQTFEGRKSVCEFSKLEFPMAQVLNHRIENTLHFPRPGHVVEGVILGRSGSRIPKQYASFTSVPCTLTLYDQFGEETTEQGHLSVGRARERAKAIETPKTDLYGNPRVASRASVSSCPEEPLLAHSCRP